MWFLSFAGSWNICMEHRNDNYDRYCILYFEWHNLTNTVSSIAVLIGKFFQTMGHSLKEKLLELVLFYILSFMVSCCLVQEISYSFELKHDLFYWKFQKYAPTKCKSFSLTPLISVISVKSNVMSDKLGNRWLTQVSFITTFTNSESVFNWEVCLQSNL